MCLGIIIYKTVLSIKYLVQKIHKESGFIVMCDIRVISQAKVMNYVRALEREKQSKYPDFST